MIDQHVKLYASFHIRAESSSCEIFAKVKLVMVSKNFIVSLVGLLVASSNAYNCGRSSFLHRTTSLQSTALAVTDDLASAVVESGKDVKQLKFEPIFKSFAQNEYFLSQVWQKKPYYVEQPLDSVKGSYTMTDVQNSVDSDFLEAGRGTFQEGVGGWNMAAVSKPRGSSFQDAKLQFADVQLALKEASGTVVFNSAGGFIPELAQVCLAAVNAFDMPCAINMYITNSGQKTSAPPHTDKQDVFVMQTQGLKRWRVFAPPPPSRMPRADPLARGKSKDTLELSELSAPLLDVVMSPGQILYVPAGFPHTTDTLNVNTEGSDPNTDPSVHLTVGVDTHIWGLNFASLRANSLKRSGLDDKVLLTKLQESVYWDLQSACAVGFLSDQGAAISGESATSSTSAGDNAGVSEVRSNGDKIVDRLVRLMLAAEPSRWASKEEAEVEVKANQAVARHVRHHKEITEIFRKMYADVAFKISPSKMDLSIFRSQPYFQQLESSMEELVQWGTPSKESSTSSKGKSTVGDKKDKKSGEKKMGFGK